MTSEHGQWMLEVLREHLGPNPLRILAQRLDREPEEVLALLVQSPALLLDLTEDPEMTAALLACIVASSDLT